MVQSRNRLTVVAALGITSLLFLICTSQAAAIQTKNVAVSKVGTASAVLVVKADVTSDVVIDYGNAPGTYTASKTGSGAVRHEITLDGLLPSTTVYYRVTLNETGNPANNTTLAEKSFKTTLAAGLPFSYSVIGDNRPGSNTTTQPAAFYTNMSQMSTEGLDLALHVGDIIYGVSTDTLAQNVAKYDGLFAATSQLTNTVPLYAVAGNHERINYTNSRAGFDQEFTMPVNNGADAATYGEEYYSFDHGDTHFIMLCTEIPGQEGLITGNQKSWLEQDLTSANKPWVVVSFHRPLFSGRHATDPWVIISNATAQQNKEELHALFNDYGVDVVFAGHDHFYLHHQEDSVHYIITGGGGSPLAGTPSLGAGDVFSASGYHHVKVDETSAQLTVRAINTSGTTLETFTVTPGEPDLSFALGETYWDSYADYLSRELSVEYSVTNDGSGDATSIQLVYLTASNGVLPLTTVPVPVGRLGNGRSVTVFVRYSVPPATSVFTASAYATCINESGDLLYFPAPAP